MEPINNDTIVVATERQLSAELGGESVILALEEGVYYGLNEVGAAIWSELRRPTRVGDLVAVVCRSFETTPEECTPDIVRLIQELLERGLVQVDSGDEPRG